MTLHEFLIKCNKDDYVGIWDVSSHKDRKNQSRERFEQCPTKQSYFKIGNIPYGRIRYLLDKEVLCINHTEKGFLVRVFEPNKTEQSFNNSDLADKIARAIKGAS